MFDRNAKLAMIIACVVLALGGVVFQSAVHALNVYLRKKPVELRNAFTLIPTRLGGWESRGEDKPLPAELVEELGTSLYLDRRYVKEEEDRDVRLDLHLAYYTGMIDAVPHVPDRCLVAAGFNVRTPPRNLSIPLDTAGWRTDDVSHATTGEPFRTVMVRDAITLRPYTVRMPLGEVALRTTEFSWSEYPDARIFAGYFFIANGRVAVTPEDVKRIAFRKSEEYAYYCKVQFQAIGYEDLTSDQFLERVGDLLDVLLPEVMRCLPDWAEVQMLSETAPTTIES